MATLSQTQFNREMTNAFCTFGKISEDINQRRRNGLCIREKYKNLRLSLILYKTIMGKTISSDDCITQNEIESILFKLKSLQ